jgi:methionine synthase II (cobalamin-independent)
MSAAIVSRRGSARASYSNRFATALDGVDIDNPGTALDRSGHPNPVPRIIGPISADAVAMAYGGAVRGEIEDLFEGGAETIILGVLDLSTDDVETADTVAARIRRAFEYVGAERLVAAPDCGMKYLSRASAYGKLEALVAGARLASATQ